MDGGAQCHTRLERIERGMQNHFNALFAGQNGFGVKKQLIGSFLNGRSGLYSFQCQRQIRVICPVVFQ